MSYVVKIDRYPYLDKYGNPTFNAEKAQIFEDKEMADLAATTCQGSVHKKIVPDKKSTKKLEKIYQAASSPKKGLTNQAWMRGDHE